MIEITRKVFEEKTQILKISSRIHRFLPFDNLSLYNLLRNFQLVVQFYLFSYFSINEK